jgi:hypothetical protein
MNPFFCFLDCSISRASDFSCNIFLGRDWFNYVSTTFPNAKISLSETEYLDFGVSPQVGVRIEQGVFFLASTFDGRNLIFWSVARDDLMDCDSNPSLVDLGFIGSDATVSDIGPGATFSHSSSLISSENPSVSGLSENETHVVSVPMNVPDFLTFIKTLTRSALISIAQSHNIAVPSSSMSHVHKFKTKSSFEISRDFRRYLKS